MIKIFLFLIICINIYAYDINEIRKDFFYSVVSKQLLQSKDTKELEKRKLKRKRQSLLWEEDIKRYKRLIFSKINKNKIKNDEYFSVVNLKKQIYTILLYVKKEDKLYLIGSDLISSGNKNKEVEVKYGDDHYFDTPTGLYEVKKGWRSKGKYKDINKTVQSFGKKDRFIFYIGKMTKQRYNSFNHGVKIKNQKNYNLINDTLNFAMHSYNTKNKNFKFGKKESHGCVRMSDELNQFLDKNLVLHKNFFNNNKWKLKNSKKPKDIKNIRLKGAYILIIDK